MAIVFFKINPRGDRKGDEVKSEFGRGFIYNLFLFIYHINNDMACRISNIAVVIKQSEDIRGEILKDNPLDKYNYGFNKNVKWWFEKIVPIWGSPEKALSHEITTWASGASDHFYELEIPQSFKKTKIGKIANDIKEKWLTIGHGFRDKEIYTYEDYISLWEDIKLLGRLIDEKLGIKSQKGQWE